MTHWSDADATAGGLLGKAFGDKWRKGSLAYQAAQQVQTGTEPELTLGGGHSSVAERALRLHEALDSTLSTPIKNKLIDLLINLITPQKKKIKLTHLEQCRLTENGIYVPM